MINICITMMTQALRLSQTALGDAPPGKVVNLLSSDVYRFDVMSMFIHALWTAPLMTLIIGYLLWTEIRWAGMVGIGIVFIIVPIQCKMTFLFLSSGQPQILEFCYILAYTGKLSTIFRLQTTLRTDERVRLIYEIITGVQVIKMYAWEMPFNKIVTLARRMELDIVLKNAYVRAVHMTFVLFTTRMALFCTMLSIPLLYAANNITAARMFVVSAYLNMIALAMAQMFVRGVAEISEALVAIERLQKFLEHDEKDTKNDSFVAKDVSF